MTEGLWLPALFVNHRSLPPCGWFNAGSAGHAVHSTHWKSHCLAVQQTAQYAGVKADLSEMKDASKQETRETRLGPIIELSLLEQKNKSDGKV